MNRSAHHAIWLAALLLVLCGRGVGVADTKSDDQQAAAKQAQPTLAGSWQAKSISMLTGDGRRTVFSGNQGPFGVVVGEKTFKMYAHSDVMADMTYVFDPKQEPWTIDLTSKDGKMLGICAAKGDDLEICLNDEAEDRPTSLDAKACGMAMTLTRFPHKRLYSINADGSDLHEILMMPEFGHIGGPECSRDGGLIALDAWRALFGESYPDTHIFVVNADGSGLKDLGLGAMPSWSPDGKQLTCSQYGPQRGVFVMNADGTGSRLIDAGGWSSRWSPKDKDEIAYTSYDGGANLSIYNLTTKQRRELLDEGCPQICGLFAWSPDGEWLCVKRSPSGNDFEVIAVHREGQEKGFKVLLQGSTSPEIEVIGSPIAWGADNEIFVSMKTKTDRAQQIYVLDFTGEKPPRLLPGVPADWTCGDVACSLDGKRVIFAAWPAVKAAE